MIGLFGLALITVATAEIINIPADGRYQIGNNYPSDGNYKVDMDFTFKSLDDSKFDVAFALISCHYGYQFIEAHPKLPESEFNVLSYRNKNTYTFRKDESYCYVIHNKNAFQSGDFVYEFKIDQTVIYPEISAKHKLPWEMIVTICCSVVGGLVVITLIYCYVKNRHKKENNEDYVQMDDKSESLISVENKE